MKRISKTPPGTMTNTQLVGEHARLMKRQSAIGDHLIADGHGRLRPSDMRENPDVHPLVPEMLALFDRWADLHIEARLRYGPGPLPLDSLVAAQGGSYRRVKP